MFRAADMMKEAKFYQKFGGSKNWPKVSGFFLVFLHLLLSSHESRLQLESKTTTILKNRQTSIAVVRDQCPTYAIFKTSLFSHYRLPLKGQ
jgi:hypothetical protein